MTKSPTEMIVETRSVSVQSRTIEIVCLTWPDGGVLYDVFYGEDCLTMEESLDHIPDDDEIRELLGRMTALPYQRAAVEHILATERAPRLAGPPATTCAECGKAVGFDGACVSPACCDMEPWVLEIIERLDLNLIRWATLPNGILIWACMGDCSCLFTVDDTDFLDRYTLLLDDGTCLDTNVCACHALPRRNPANYPEVAIPFATDITDRRVRLAAVLATYDVTKVDGDTFDTEYLVGDNRFVLVEEDTCQNGEVFVTLHASPALAENYARTQDHADEWRPVRLVNLDTGDSLPLWT